MTRTFPLTKSISTASNIGNINNENETAKNAEMHRLPTVLHIPDIKPRYSSLPLTNNQYFKIFLRTRRESGSSVISSSSLIPTSNIKEIGSKLGRSLLNLATMLTGADSFDAKIQTTVRSTSQTFDMKPLPPTPGSKPRDTPIIPRRPPRRKMSFDRSRHKSLTGDYVRFKLGGFSFTSQYSGIESNFQVEDTIEEVETPLGSPTFEREPKVPMPG